MILIERLRATNKRVRHSQELRDEAADALEQAQKYAPYPDDQALAGESMPPIKSILDLIRYCTTIHNRFGNTCVDDLSLKWGGSALNYKSELRERIEQLEIVGEEIAQDRNTANDRLSEARKRITLLESESCEGGIKDAVIAELTGLINESHGVDGLHLNGDLADWDWLMNNQWLEKYADFVSEGLAPDDGEGQAAALSEIDR